MLRPLYFILCLFLLSCQKKPAELTPTPQELIIGEWKEYYSGLAKRADRDQNKPFALRADALQGISFSPDSTLIYKTGFFEYLEGFSKKRRAPYKYLGDTSSYFIRNDSLYFYDLKDHKWTPLNIQKLTKDTLILRRDKDFAASYVKQNIPKTTRPEIDRITFTSHRCMGYCPIYDLILNKNGEVILFGYDFLHFEGPHIANIGEKRFNAILENFRKASPYDLKEQYSSGNDGWGMTLSLAHKNYLFKSIYNFEFEEMPAELYWAYRPLIFMYEEVDFKPLPLADLPDYLDVIVYKFKYDKLVGNLESTESLLLWDYLRNGKETQDRFEELYTLTFTSLRGKYDNWLPPSHLASATKSISKITSDGRYYKFYYKAKPPVTVDLGFNFVDNNPGEISFVRDRTK